VAAPSGDDRGGGDLGSDTDFDAVLVDGTLVHLRPPTPADRPALTDLHARLSRRSAYLRFFSLSQRAPGRYLDRILAPDGTDLPGLVALIGDRPVAVASYARLGGGEAEVAFLVDDEHQGLGISTLLLETLAADASRRGITRFVAEVLPENEAMLDVFRAAGFAASPRFREGTVRVTFPLTRTEALLAAVGERERRADARSIARLLAPSSVAVLGSRTGGDVGRRILTNLKRGGYQGAVHAVSSGELPAGIDLAILTVSTEEVLTAAARCADAGVRNLLVTSGGFADAGPAGSKREAELVLLARRGGMRLVGPQSLGVINTAADVRMCATPTATRPRAGSVGIMSHSRALGVAMLAETTRRGLGVSSFVSGGNTADVSGNDLLLYWEQDPATTVVVLYLERFGNPRKFARIARRLARSKPVLVVASGRSTAGARAASPPRAAAAIEPAAVDALFRQTGVIRLNRVEELFGVLDVLVTEPLPGGRRVAVVGNSAAAGALAADAAVAAGLSVPELDAATQEQLRTVLPPGVAVVNPVDLLEPATAASYASALPVLLATPEVDAVLISHAVYPGRRCDVADAAAAAAEQFGKPVVASLLGGGRPARRPTSKGHRRRVPAFSFPETAARSLATLADYADWRLSPAGREPTLSGIDPESAGRRLQSVLTAAAGGAPLPRSDAVALLGDYGIAVQATAVPPTGETDRAGRTSWTVGVVQDPLFGPLVSFGAAGVASELFSDIAHHVLPLTDADAERLIRSLRCSPLLFGHRGGPHLAADALTDLLLRVARLAENHREVSRLHLDPVVVTTEDAQVADVRVQVAPAVRAPSAWLRRLR
jgi:acyl-CoA synthetase (NDP forming)/RimJ/RimL family protein N-acetyltransferase